MIATDCVQRVALGNTEVAFMVHDNQTLLLGIGESQNYADNYLKLAEAYPACFKLTELQISGENKHISTQSKGGRLNGSYAGTTLAFKDFEEKATENGKILTINEESEELGINVVSYFEMYEDSQVVRVWKTIKNVGTEDVGLEAIPTIAYTGVMQQGLYPYDYTENMSLIVPSNAWEAELQWHSHTLKDLGLVYDAERVEPNSQRVSYSNRNSWSSAEYSPEAILYDGNSKQVAMWQIENNGAWHYELGDSQDGLLNLQISGPEEHDTHWWKSLSADESFTTVPVGFVQMTGNFESAIDEMTKYRRIIRRANDDDVKLPIIFNDYMNCLMGDPTTEKEIPLIDAAKEAGAEYFVVDCGWYADGFWWDSIGEWKESKKRFPNGLIEVMDYIKSKDMVPGLWLEIETMGVKCPLIDQLPDEWFFMRHGHKVKDTDRYHLDFRNPEVRDFATKTVDRLINDYHIGYIKMDYNTPTGIGTDYNSDSVGEGLLSHNRAYLQWVDETMDKYPNLVIENCGSGGMRHDYAMLSRHSIQSATDQTDYIQNGAIAAVGASAMTPEQCAIWSYPLNDGDEEETIYNMVNSMLVRVHQSGYLNELSSSRFDLVKEGISVYKSYRDMIPNAVPVWPTGLANINDSSTSYGLIAGDKLLLSVSNVNEYQGDMTLDLHEYGHAEDVKQIYPQNDEQVSYKLYNDQLQVKFPHDKMARLYEVKLNK
ncbi:glycoside hydrolase family 36 protein [Weissella bombi]|uniref:Alpha-galactosidase n=1 Tax=Weissella bombi TaxID=1505725 RepID=A0A1C4BK64_9LACO|nr:alpha-galactosidase [Weissella bombi]SCC07237.1 alpha-galactosidase [Weissella bombi]